jgi:hypothetical protein
VLFTALHVVGSKNNRRKKDSKAMLEFSSRDKANKDFLKASFRQAKREDAVAMVILFHADPGFERDQPLKAYRSLIKTLAKRMDRWDKPVLLIHGDSHRLLLDRPLKNPDTDSPFPNVTRLEVPGSPLIHLMRVWVDTENKEKMFKVELFDPLKDEQELGWDKTKEVIHIETKKEEASTDWDKTQQEVDEEEKEVKEAEDEPKDQEDEPEEEPEEK